MTTAGLLKLATMAVYWYRIIIWSINTYNCETATAQNYRGTNRLFNLKGLLVTPLINNLKKKKYLVLVSN